MLTRFPKATLDIVGPATRACRQFLDPGHDEPLLEPLERFFRDRESYQPELQRRLSPAAAAAVRFIGCVPHSQLRSYFQNADVFVIPSIINEPFGIPLAEAMSSGLPTIATRGGGFPEIVDDERTGLLVPRGDAPALDEAMTRLLADRPLRLAMGAAVRERVVERFSWDVIMPQLETAYGLGQNPGVSSRPAHVSLRAGGGRHRGNRSCVSDLTSCAFPRVSSNPSCEACCASSPPMDDEARRRRR